MSCLQSTRRLSLLSGVSLGTACLIGTAGLVMAPSASRAATNPCGTNPATNGAAPDTIVCPVATYSTGIQHTSNGDISVTVQMGTNYGTGGTTTTAGAAADDVTVRLTGGVTSTATQINQAFPVLLDAQSQDGNILVDVATTRTTSGLANLNASNAATTHFVRAISGTGDVVVTRTLDANSSASSSIIATNGIGVEARSLGGGDVSVSAITSGRLHGILASTTGTGALTIIGGGGATGPSAAYAGISATTSGSGLMNITVTNASSGGAGGAAAIRTSAGGDANINISAVNISVNNAASWVIDATAGAGTTTTINNGGSIHQGSGSEANHDDQIIRGAGAGRMVINSSGRMVGVMNLTALGGGANVNVTNGALNGAGWFTAGLNVFSAANDILATSADGVIKTSVGTLFGRPGVNLVIPAGGIATTFDFGAGADTFTNNGVLVVGLGYAANEPDNASTVTFVNLEVFDNAGAILLGTRLNHDPAIPGPEAINPQTSTDGKTDDVLRMSSGVFNGLGGRVTMDFNPLGGVQTNCTDRDASNVLPAADCLDLRGASTAGETFLVVRDKVPALRAQYNPEGVVLVDVSGAGTSAAEHFVLSPDTLFYDPAFGGVIDKGDFIYALVYDADAQQHKLVSVPGGALQFAPMVQAVQDIWRTSTDTLLDRRSEQRDHGDAGLGGNVWIRAVADQGERDLTQTSQAAGRSFDFDSALDQRTIAVVAGADLMSVDARDFSYTAGVALGYARSDIEFAHSPNTAELRGLSGGVYGGFAAGNLYVDGAVNAVGLAMDNDMPALALLPTGTILSTNVRALGARVEAGWRLPLSSGVFVEPLAGVTYSSATFEDVDIGTSGDVAYPGNTLEFDDAVSLRGGLGARVGVGGAYGALNVQASVTGRVWNEFDGEVGFTIDSAGPDAPVAEAFAGTYSDLGAALALSDEAGAFSGFVNAGGKFGDGYQSTSVAAGLRYRW